jgi:hypothetical protein
LDFYGFRLTNTNNPSITAAGTFAIQRGSTAAWNDDFVMDNSGNIGIGTSGPVAKLDVVGGNGDGIQYRTSTRSIGIGQISSQASLFWGSSTDLTFFAGSELARLTSAGNLGLGVTPRAWSGGYKSFDITGPGAIASTASGDTFTQVANGAWFNGTNWIYQYTGVGAARYQMTGPSGGGNHSWHVAATGTAGNAISFTQAMTLDASGNLGIGTSSPAEKLDVVGNCKISSGSSFYWGDATSQIVADNGGAMRFLTGTAAERARITSTGLVGIGTSAPTSNGGSAAGLVHIHGAASGANAADGLIVGNIGADAYIYNYENSPIIFATNSAERMRLDTNGDLALGATSVARVGSDRTLYIEGSSFASLNLACGGAYAGAGLTINSSAALEIRNTGAERARIDTNGRMVINGTVAAYSSTLTLYRAGNSYNLTSTVTGTGNEGHVVFENGNGAVGTIFTNGTATAYNTSSDYRLKNTIAPMTGALAKVALLKPCTYKWNADGSDGQGFIAHELAEVVPQCVTGEKDAVDAEGKPRYQGVDTSFLVATLTAAIQELTARVAQLETK